MKCLHIFHTTFSSLSSLSLEPDSRGSSGRRLAPLQRSGSHYSQEELDRHFPDVDTSRSNLPGGQKLLHLPAIREKGGGVSRLRRYSIGHGT